LRISGASSRFMATAVPTATATDSSSSPTLRASLGRKRIGATRTRQISQAAGNTTTATLKAMRQLSRSRASLGSVCSALAIMVGSMTTRYSSM